jgi:hypothetical protein
MDIVRIRKNSLIEVATLGYRTNPGLPFLEASAEARPINEIISRALALHTVIAVSFGFATSNAISWLHQHGLSGALSPRERAFLHSPGFDHVLFHPQIEALWAFAWVFGRILKLDFSEPCGDNLVALYPDLQKNEDIKQWSSLISIRSTIEIFSACDLAYCLHWAINQGRIDGNLPTSRLHPQGVIERRRALEWILGSDDWDNVLLDT